MKDVWNHRPAHVSIKSYILLQLGISSLDIFYKMRKKTTSDSKWRVWHIMTHLDQSELQTKTSKWQPSFSNSSAWKRQFGCIHQITLGYHVLGRFLWVPNLTSNRKNKTDWWLTPQFLAVKLLLTKKMPSVAIGTSLLSLCATLSAMLVTVWVWAQANVVQMKSSESDSLVRSDPFCCHWSRLAQIKFNYYVNRLRSSNMSSAARRDAGSWSYHQVYVLPTGGNVTRWLDLK